MVKVVKQRSIRSIQQNAYLWGVVYKVTAEALGYTVPEMHETWKWEFLPRVRIMGIRVNDTMFSKVLQKFHKQKREIIEIPISTTKLNTKQFGEYLDSIHLKASELGIRIPLPNETIQEEPK